MKCEARILDRIDAETAMRRRLERLRSDANVACCGGGPCSRR